MLQLMNCNDYRAGGISDETIGNDRILSPVSPTKFGRGDPAWVARRNDFQAHLSRQTPNEISEEEIEVHFAGMPAHYWENVNNDDLLWGLETIHGFLKLMNNPSVPATTPFVSWRAAPQGGPTRLMLCTWDRHGLLAKAAAAFSAVRLNILKAEVFTRTDNVVLDMFTFVDFAGHGVTNAVRLQEMIFLLDGALSEPPRFASVWACSRHKFLEPPGQFGLRITFDNDSSAVSTLVHVQASDRLGLLYDLLQALADNGLGITQASIQTDNGLAHDIIHVTNAQGQKVLEPGELGALRRSLEAAMTISND